MIFSRFFETDTLVSGGVKRDKRKQAEDLSLTSETPSKKSKGVAVHYESTYKDRGRYQQRGRDRRNWDRGFNRDNRDYAPRGGYGGRGGGGRGGRGGRDGRNNGGSRGNDCPQLTLITLTEMGFDLTPLSKTATTSTVNRLQKCLSNWRVVTKNEFVLRIISEGYKIQFTSPLPRRNQPIYYDTNSELHQHTSLEVKNLVEKEAIVPVSYTHLTLPTKA